MHLPGTAVDDFQTALLLLHILQNFIEHSDLASDWCLFFSLSPTFNFIYTFFSCKTLNFLFLVRFMQEQNYEFSIKLQEFLPGLRISVLLSFAVAWQQPALILLLWICFSLVSLSILSII